MKLIEFYQLGSESYYSYKNKFIRTFIRIFGPLGINAKIRSGHVIRNIQKLRYSPGNSLKILDVGCGVAYIDFWFAKHYQTWSILGIDIDEKAVSKACNIKNSLFQKNLDFKLISINDLELVNEFDLVYSMDVLEHIYNDTGALKRIHGALKEDGLLILHLPLRYNLNKRILPGFSDFSTIDHVRPEYTMDEIFGKLLTTDFYIQESYYSYSNWGELAFELNYLNWKKPKVRLLFAFLFHFLSNIFGFIDIQKNSKSGNGLVIISKKKTKIEIV